METKGIRRILDIYKTKTMEKHNKLIDILVKYGNEEFGDNIIDEISELFNYPKTKEIND
jgi:dissimilatory sulfite reductase (desulfoviridin) alpha/beta subunit|tara:strand:+ start:65 stop:241 length:177 start_codon:yes stop_codon:yes gene_type:complete